MMEHLGDPNLNVWRPRRRDSKTEGRCPSDGAFVFVVIGRREAPDVYHVFRIPVRFAVGIEE